MNARRSAIRLWPRGDGGKFLAWMVGSFAVVFAVNGTFVWLALSTWTGLTTDHPYERGLAYNQTLQREADEAALGWKTDMQFAGGRLQVGFHDRHGVALDRLTVDARFVRPTSEGSDQTVALEPIGNGRYAAKVALPLRGQWDVVVDARGRAGQYRLARRLFVP